MTSIKPLSRRLARVQEQLCPHERETRLPYLVIDEETGESWPGYEEHNEEHQRLALRLGVPANVYLFDPNQDGCEP